MTTHQVLRILSKYKFYFNDEKDLQDKVEDVLKSHGVAYKREYRLSSSDIVDFFIDGLAVELKVKGHPVSVYKQCSRYCEHESVKELLLVTSKSFALPDIINSKSVSVYYLSAL